MRRTGTAWAITVPATLRAVNALADSDDRTAAEFEMLMEEGPNGPRIVYEPCTTRAEQALRDDLAAALAAAA